MSTLSPLLDRARSDAAVDFTHIYVDDGDPQYVLPGKQYIRIWLRFAHIIDTQHPSSKFYPAVFGQSTFVDHLQSRREVIGVIAPDTNLEETGSRDRHNLIVFNRPILGPIPYHSGLTVDIALFSVVAADLAKPFLNLLTDLTSTASTFTVNQAQPFVESIKRGAELLLFDVDHAHFEVGLAHTDTKLRTGNLLVARMPTGSSIPEGFRIDPHNFRLLDDNGQPVTAFSYMILGVEESAERTDYAAIPEISVGWEAVRLAAAEGGSVSEVNDRFDELRHAIWLSPDLIQADKKRIEELFSREILDARYDVAPPDELKEMLPPMRPPMRPLRDAALVFEGVHPLSLPRPVSTMETIQVTERISMRELQEMMSDPDIPDAELRKYFVANPDTSRPYEPAIIPDPARVEVAVPTDALEGMMAMNMANLLYRLRRQKKFNQRRAQGSRQMVLVSEGDSWFLFPIFLNDVIDQLFADFNIWSVDAAGDTLQNMVLDNAEYLQALRKNKDDVRAFLFSGGGNDIIGVDEFGKPIISQLVKRFEPGRTADWYLDTDEFAAKLRFIESCYREVISNVSAEFRDLPIICHGYDYAIPGGGPDDTRNPLWAARDQWIGRALRVDLGITDHQLQKTIVHLMIDRLNERLKSLCGGNNPNGAFRNAWHVDIRGTVGTLWADEIHPTDEGFRLAAARFHDVLRSALG